MYALRALLVVLIAGCAAPAPRAGVITADDAALLLPRGETAGGRPGDYYLRNEHAVFVIQRPGRELALGPYGGSLIDAAAPGGIDRFGELIPTLALGRTIAVYAMRVVSDGTGDEPAIVEALGLDATNVAYNLEAVEPALISYQQDGSGVLGHDPDAALGLHVRIRYQLPIDEARLRITYTFENLRDARQGVPFGFIVDTRANVETFIPGSGYATALSRSVDPQNLATALTYDQKTSQLVVVAEDSALSIVPRQVGARSPPSVLGAQMPMLGGVLLLNARTIAAAAKDPSFTLEPFAKVDVALDVVLAPTAARALARGWELVDQELAEVHGCVTLSTGGPAAQVRVGFVSTGGDPIGTATTDAAGCATARLPPGSYRVLAGTGYRTPSAEVEVAAPGEFALSLVALGTLAVEVAVFDELTATDPVARPCRVTLVGTRQPTEHPALGAAPYDDPGGVVARQALLASCRGEIALAAGRYLAVVTRGPEFDRVEALVDVSAGEVTSLAGALHRVVDTEGYAASDFHVHSVYSPDSRVPAAERVLSLAAEGLDFWASTDHDVVTDFTPVVAELGLAAALATIPGAEVTTFDLGHFGAFPLPFDHAHANGGAPDWAPDDAGRRLPMADLFDAIHRTGALVQVNHPRAGGVALGAYFSRAGVVYDPVTRRPHADAARQPIANELLRYPAGLAYFSDDFDVIEVMNGPSTYVTRDMVYDRGVELVGHDWMNLLAAGRTVVAVANSDTHTTGAAPGNPRTLVGGHAGGRPSLVAALGRGDAILTTGPMLRATVIAEAGTTAGPGELLSPTTTTVVLRVHVETPDWFVADRVEVVANAFFADPTAAELPPRAVPLALLTPSLVRRANGGAAWVGEVELPLDLEAPPFDSHDSWLVVRVGGVTSNVWPVMQGGGGTVDPTATSPDAFLTNRSGARPFAMTNAIYLDVDRDGDWRP